MHLLAGFHKLSQAAQHKKFQMWRRQADINGVSQKPARVPVTELLILLQVPSNMI